MLLGALTSSWPAEKRVDDEKTRKIPEKHWPMACIGRHTRPEASTSGFPDSLGPSPPVNELGYVPSHRQGERNGRQVRYFFVVFLWHLNPLVRPGQYSRNTRPMAASSGFAWSPEPLLLGDIGGVPAHEPERRNGSDGGAFVWCQWFRDRPKPILLTQ
jgi:hypothetical protein